MEIQREDPPHGECEVVNDAQNQLKNLWRSQFYWLDYTSDVSFQSYCSWFSASDPAAGWGGGQET